MIHLALDANQTYCGKPVHTRNADAFLTQCVGCLTRLEGRLWAQVNEAKARGNAAEFDEVRDLLEKVRKHRDRQLRIV